MYDRAAVFWQTIVMVITHLQDMGVYGGMQNRRQNSMLNAQLWGAHMRFFRQMLMASKARYRSTVASSFSWYNVHAAAGVTFATVSELTTEAAQKSTSSHRESN